jgi:tripartite-type tricarboxylate transporter receptor subunit TctC
MSTAAQAGARNVLAAAIGITLGLAAAPAHAQPYPNRPIRLIVPFPAGGPIDVMARLVGQKLSSGFGPVVVENRPGGGSTVGLKAVATAEPDGYTLLFGGTMTLSVLPALAKSPEGDAIKGMTPIVLVSATPFVLIVSPRVPAQSVQELIAYAKANPGKLNFGAPAGATPLLVGELFKMKAGIDFTTVPYRGAATTMTDMITGQIDMALEPSSVVIAHLSEGKIRPLAVTSRARNAELPAMPTMIESGVPEVVAVSWTGVTAPAGTPAAIVTRLNQAINDALKSEDMMLALRKLGSEPLGGPPQDFVALLADESPKWIEVVKASGLKID